MTSQACRGLRLPDAVGQGLGLAMKALPSLRSPSDWPPRAKDDDSGEGPSAWTLLWETVERLDLGTVERLDLCAAGGGSERA